MNGILFLKTKGLESLKTFYIEKIGCELWQDQNDCAIFRHGNFLFGFCERDDIEDKAMLTFFYESKEEVDRMYEKLRDIAESRPVENEKYNIYQFFAKDPEGRTIECQYFNDPVARHLTGENLLLTRRSVRKFTNETVPQDVLDEIFEICRFVPTSRNTQGYYYKLIDDRETLDWLSRTRESSTAPIANAQLAVAICADPNITGRADHDACIAAYHFMLTAWFFGLGTCWMGGMDREDIKDRLEIPQTHYLATVTPLGYPARRDIKAPKRKPSSDFVR